jgi:uncharacterized protein (DUF1810 family)
MSRILFAKTRLRKLRLREVAPAADLLTTARLMQRAGPSRRTAARRGYLANMAGDATQPTRRQVSIAAVKDFGPWDDCTNRRVAGRRHLERKVWELEDDPFSLQRFVVAQATTFEAALAELRAGSKRSHWMWFVFPQLRGLGRSPAADFYGIASAEEASAYLAHGELGPRLQLATRTVLSTNGRSIHTIFGSPDDMKFRSSMSLFAFVSPRPDPFHGALERWFGGRMDDATLELLDAPGRTTT